MNYPPNSEQVAVGWLKTIPGINLAATTIPARSPEFAQHGFVQVTSTVGGVPDNDTGMQGPIIQIDTWAYQEGSKKVPWGKAATLAAMVKAAVEGRVPRPGRIETPDTFDDAFLHTVLTHMDPRRIVNDEGMARYTMDLRLFWTRIPAQEAA